MGICLKHLPDEGSVPAGMLSRFHTGSVPWQRIISAKGVISPRGLAAGGAGGRDRQAAALRAEGIEVMVDALGELSVDLDRYGWFPRQLPSAASGGRHGAQEGDDEEASSDGELQAEKELDVKEEDVDS